jgi:site-specific DNA-methyltransferase (adenine-specific)
LEGDITPIVKRFADLFGQDPYRDVVILDCRPLNLQRSSVQLPRIESEENEIPPGVANTILNGDCMKELRLIPPNSIDFVFTDPPYNLGKKYVGCTDDLEIQSYFKWCDEWIGELSRVLKPGRTLALLNIPLWAVRHFLYIKSLLQFQNWIVWDALAFPVRLIMPAHYAVLCFTKGESRALPGLTGQSHHIRVSSAPRVFNSLEPLADGFCLRANCVDTRIRVRINDRANLTDVWGDIHRLKHNTRRVDHPCQLPALLMYRLISIFTKPREVILDCFNGAGTTTLSAHQINRKYIGIDSSELYCAMAQERHSEILSGIDPFRKAERVLTSKNSPVPRLPKQVYRIPKKTLQLEVRRISKELGHIPSRDEVIKYAKYPIDYYDRYFISWGEVTAAARTTGMTEKHVKHAMRQSESSRQLDFLGSP